MEVLTLREVVSLWLSEFKRFWLLVVVSCLVVTPKALI